MKDLDSVIAQVVATVKRNNRLTLSDAESLAKKVFDKAKNEGKAVVVALVNDQGRPILVEVMDGAFLVSFDVALKKAYTAVAVKSSTAALVEEVRPGGSLEGLERERSLLILGGGEPLYKNGVLVGGVAVSGGTAAEDSALAKYAADIFKTL